MRVPRFVRATRGGKFINCKICNNVRWEILSRLKKGFGIYCSVNCYNKDKKGRIPWNKGKELSKSHRKNLSKAQIKRFDRDGRSALYFTFRNLYLRKSLKYTQWRTAVFKRDNYTCQKCSFQGYVEANHIVSFAKTLEKNNIQSLKQAYRCKELWDINNGETLCKNCHSKTDNYKGKNHGPITNYNFITSGV